MPFNGLGTFVLPAGNPVVTGTTISSTTENSNNSDFATGLTNCLTRDGQSPPTANLPMGAFKHTNVANGSARNEYATIGQIQDSYGLKLGGVAGVDTITASLTPALSAYSAGQFFTFTPAGSNTGAVTINVNGLGAKSVKKYGTTALAAGDLAAARVAVIIYDGTQFQLLNPPDLFESVEVTIASAATTDIGAASSGRVQITGTTAITSFGTQANRTRIVRFAGALTLTYNATSLILPGSANITTVAGDEAIFTSDGSGNWRCVAFTPIVVPQGTPTGTVIYVAKSTAPTGYLKADGSAVSRTTYAALFAEIGTTFGAGDGSTTFNLPDLRGEFIRGWDDGRGVDAARANGSSQSGAIQSHTHPMLPGFALNARVGVAGGGTTGVFADGGATDTAATGGTETRPRNVALLACIKT